MRVLFLHQNFPGQFLHVASALRGQGGHELIAVVPDGNDRPPLIPVRTYRFAPRGLRTTVKLAEHYTERIACGEAVASVLLQLRHEGFTPDIVVGHGGWGETLFVRDVWPNCRILLHAEFHYLADGADAGFDPEFSGVATLRYPMHVRTRNTAMTLALLDADRGVAPHRVAGQPVPRAAAFENRGHSRRHRHQPGAPLHARRGPIAPGRSGVAFGR